MRRRGESGFALIMAVAAAALFAWAGFTFMEAGGGDIAMAQARLERARLEAAAEAGLALAVYGLGLNDRTGQWQVDGRPRHTRFDGVALTITIEDERGKVPITTANELVVRRLLSLPGLETRQTEALAAAILDWVDTDDFPRDGGGESEWYRKTGTGLLPRNGRIRTLDELLAVRGMTPEILAGIKPAMTLYFGEPASFNARNAHPAALSAMLGRSGTASGTKERRAPPGERRPNLEITDDPAITGRPVTIRVLAELSGSARTEHSTIVQFTASPARPYWIRSYQ